MTDESTPGVIVFSEGVITEYGYYLFLVRLFRTGNGFSIVLMLLFNQALQYFIARSKCQTLAVTTYHILFGKVRLPKYRASKSSCWQISISRNPLLFNHVAISSLSIPNK